jgi:hypothetical protein
VSFYREEEGVLFDYCQGPGKAKVMSQHCDSFRRGHKGCPLGSVIPKSPFSERAPSQARS